MVVCNLNAFKLLKLMLGDYALHLRLGSTSNPIVFTKLSCSSRFKTPSPCHSSVMLADAISGS